MTRSKYNGFTIVELLIVIVIIGILAAIVIVAYNGITSRAQESALQNDLTSAAKKLGIYKATNGTYPTNTTELAAADLRATKSVYDTVGNNFYYCYNRVTGAAAMGGRAVTTSIAYIEADGSLQKVGAVGGDQVCQAAGLTGWTDTNAFISNGYNNGGSGWSAWVK